MSSKFRLLFIPLLYLLSFSPAQAHEHDSSTASLKGKIDGIHDAILYLHLVPVTDNPLHYYEGYEARVESNGDFQLTFIPPGKYSIHLEEDFWPVNKIQILNSYYASPRNPEKMQVRDISLNFPDEIPAGIIELHAGESRKGLNLHLLHRLSICGHLLQETSPVDQAGRHTGETYNIHVYGQIKVMHYNREFRVFDNSTTIDTDTEGNYSISDLPQGTYFLSVHSNMDVWYPSASHFQQAAPVEVGINEPDKCNTDITVPFATGQKGASYSIFIDGGDPDQNYKAMLLARNPDGPDFKEILYSNAGNPLHSGSEVTIPSALQGTYTAVLFADGHQGDTIWGDAPTQKIIFDSQLVTIQADSEGKNKIVFKPHPMARIEGHLHLENLKLSDFCQLPQCHSIYVSILREGNGEFQTVNLSQDNSFQFYNVTPGEYQLFVYSTRPDRAFLKSITAAGEAGQGNHFQVRSAVYTPLEVTLSGNLAEAPGHPLPDVRHFHAWETEGMRPRGKLVGKLSGDPTLQYHLRLLPITLNNTPAFLIAKPDKDGGFEFDDVPPGAYELVADDGNALHFAYGAKSADIAGTPLLLSPGAQLTGIDFAVPQRSAICGHLTTLDHAALRNSTIRYKTLVATSQNQYSQESAPVFADNDGYFKIENLLPGDYYLAANISTSRNFLNPLSADGDAEHFLPVHLENGQMAGCGAAPPLEFHLPAQGTTHTLSGTLLSDQFDQFDDRFSVEIRIARNTYPFQDYPLTIPNLDAAHHFSLTGIHAGQYNIKIFGTPAASSEATRKSTASGHVQSSIPNRQLLASQFFTVEDKDVELKIQTLHLPLITGHAGIDRQNHFWGTFGLQGNTLQLTALSSQYFANASVKNLNDSERELDFGTVEPGDYELTFPFNPNRPFDAPCYKSVLLDGKPADPHALNISGDKPLSLDLDFNCTSASLQAHVKTERSEQGLTTLPSTFCQSPANNNFTILLFPASYRELDIRSDRFIKPRYEDFHTVGKSCESMLQNLKQSMDGKLHNVQSGDYLLLALRDITVFNLGNRGQGNLTVEQRKLWRELAKIATPLTLHPGDDLTLELTDKSIEAQRISAELGMPLLGDTVEKSDAH